MLNFKNNIISVSLNHTFHKRYIRPIHSFTYKNISILVDIEGINPEEPKSIFFSINRFNLFSWHSNDHGNKEGDLLNWVKKELIKHGSELKGKVFLHCFPRIFGKVFNPLSIYFCFDKSNKLYSIIYEVRNTYGGYHSYVSILKKDKKQHTEKKFFVSPFLPIKGNYLLNAKIDNSKIKINVDMYSNKKRLLEAIQIGKIIPLNSKNLLLSIIKGYAIPFKPFLSILYESIKLLIKGGKYKVDHFKNKHTTSKVIQR